MSSLDFAFSRHENKRTPGLLFAVSAAWSPLGILLAERCMLTKMCTFDAIRIVRAQSPACLRVYPSRGTSRRTEKDDRDGHRPFVCNSGHPALYLSANGMRLDSWLTIPCCHPCRKAARTAGQPGEPMYCANAAVNLLSKDAEGPQLGLWLTAGTGLSPPMAAYKWLGAP